MILKIYARGSQLDLGSWVWLRFPLSAVKAPSVGCGFKVWDSGLVVWALRFGDHA